MKTAYCIADCAVPLRIIFSDKLLKRLKELKSYLKKIQDTKPRPWKEVIHATIVYGKNVWVKNAENVLVYEHTNDGPVTRWSDMSHKWPYDDVVWINVYPDSCNVEISGHEGPDYPLGISDKCTIEGIPEVFFSSDFVRHIKEKRFYTREKKFMNAVLKGMQDKHRELLKKAIKKTI